MGLCLPSLIWFFFFLSLHWICYSIASVLFWFFGWEACEVLAPWPDQWTPCIGRQSPSTGLSEKSPLIWRQACESNEISLLLSKHGSWDAESSGRTGLTIKLQHVLDPQPIGLLQHQVLCFLPLGPLLPSLLHGIRLWAQVTHPRNPLITSSGDPTRADFPCWMWYLYVSLSSSLAIILCLSLTYQCFSEVPPPLWGYVPCLFLLPLSSSDSYSRYLLTCRVSEWTSSGKWWSPGFPGPLACDLSSLLMLHSLWPPVWMPWRQWQPLPRGSENCLQSLSGGQAVTAGSQEGGGGPAGCWEELAILTLAPGGPLELAVFASAPLWSSA